jgi:hypothetical protein
MYAENALQPAAVEPVAAVVLDAPGVAPVFFLLELHAVAPSVATAAIATIDVTFFTCMYCLLVVDIGNAGLGYRIVGTAYTWLTVSHFVTFIPPSSARRYVTVTCFTHG